MGPADDFIRDLLRLTLTPDLGPVRIARLIEAFGSPAEVLAASPAQLARVKGIGSVLAGRAARGFTDSDRLVDEELDRISKAGVNIVVMGRPEYPSLLEPLPGAPPILLVKGQLRPNDLDRYTVAIVGSRRCSIYGLEQSERFGAALARDGLTVVSGGARGVDTAAHRGALAAGGRTIAVLGCGLGLCYPPENADLFDDIVAAGGAIISELPMTTPPDGKNFPARNRIISGLSLGVLVIEAGSRSGALITARYAVEDHGREVMVLPGRVDSGASAGSLGLLKSGAALVTEPADVIELLEGPARHQFDGTHAAMTADPTRDPGGRDGLFTDSAGSKPEPASPPTQLDPVKTAILDALTEPMTIERLCEQAGLEPGVLRAELTLLEMTGRVRRAGGLVSRGR